MEEQAFREHGAGKADELHYVSVDGAMFLTREEGWKENKPDRIYTPDDIVQLSPKRTGLTPSEYVTHPGDHGEFTKRMNYHLENLNSLVFIADGARWIWKWADRNHPESVQIVYYYHFKEHLCEFAKLYFKEETERHKWIDRLSGTMLEKGIDLVIAEIEKLPERQRTKKLIAYYRRNRVRMQYHEFLEKGLLIGSSAIESTHRDVLQQRLKLSGQRWTMAGFQQMAQLRVVYKSEKEHRIRELCQKAA